MIERSPDPARFALGHDLKARGERVPSFAERPWFCRTCGAEAPAGRHVPRGWYSLTKHSGTPDERAIRCGVFCSAVCVERQLPRIVGIEAEMGELAFLRVKRDRPGVMD